MVKWSFGLLPVLGGLLVLGCSSEALSPGEGVSADSPVISWLEFKASAEKKSTIINGEKIYIVEWDIPIRESTLYDYYVSHFIKTDKSTVDVLSTGGDNVWSTAAKATLSYCISTTFGSNYARMQGEMARATWAWAREANVRFLYRQWDDTNCVDSNTDVEIPVQPFSGGGACAFFPMQDGRPNCTSAGRALVIDIADIDSWPTTLIYGQYYPNLTTEGTLRHELGHVIGLRHEHIRDAGAAINNCVSEYNNPGPYRALTDYERESVMHYPWCNGPTTFANLITRRDAQGARSLYGSPAWIDTVL